MSPGQSVCVNVARPVSLCTVAVINSARKALLERAKQRASIGGTPLQTQHPNPVSNIRSLMTVSNVYFVSAAAAELEVWSCLFDEGDVSMRIMLLDRSSTPEYRGRTT